MQIKSFKPSRTEETHQACHSHGKKYQAGCQKPPEYKEITRQTRFQKLEINVAFPREERNVGALHA